MASFICVALFLYDWFELCVSWILGFFSWRNLSLRFASRSLTQIPGPIPMSKVAGYQGISEEILGSIRLQGIKDPQGSLESKNPSSLLVQLNY